MTVVSNLFLLAANNDKSLVRDESGIGLFDNDTVGQQLLLLCIRVKICDLSSELSVIFLFKVIGLGCLLL